MDQLINPNLDIAPLKEQFSLNRRIRVPSFLDLQRAQNLFSTLNKIDYKTALYIDEKNVTFSGKELSALSEINKKNMNEKVIRNAAEGVGFVYGRHFIDEHSPLSGFLKWLNSESTLRWAREVSGANDIVSASAQATRYVSGNFLTRHNDVVAQEGRRIAYVINLAPKWHPDWGGLLQFFEPDGTTTESWSPEFNTLSLFDVKHIHSVTYVTPFAKQPRYALTGWFKAK